MINSAFFIGCPVEFQKLCLIYPPKVRDVLAMPKYDAFVRLLTISQEEIEDAFVRDGQDLARLLTPFEYLFNVSFNSKDYEQTVKEAFQFFTKEDIIFLYQEKKIVFGSIDSIKNLDDLRILTEDNYFEFQNLIRDAVGMPAAELPNPNEHPKIKRMKALQRERDRVKAKSGKGLKTSTMITALCCMGLGLTPLNIGELSYAAVAEILRMYQEKEKYDLDIRSLLAGADSKKVKPKYWIHNKED